MGRGDFNRREMLQAGAAAVAALVLRGAPALAQTGLSRTYDFAALGEGEGWPGWACPGVANVRRSGGNGLLEAGSDVFPCDPRPVAFTLDSRFRDGQITAVVDAAGAGTGLVLRRVGPRDYYAAVYDSEQHALVIVRRSGTDLVELAHLPVVAVRTPIAMSFAATGASPTELTATIDAGAGLPLSVSARDAAPALQRAGDPGVLATARTLFPSQGPPVLPALGNLHLLPYGVQEGQAFMQTAVGQEVLAAIRERSTAAFREIAIRSGEQPTPTAPSVVAATSGAPVTGGARLRVATDVPARVEIELANSPDFRHRRTVRLGRTDGFDAARAVARRLRPGRRVYWRARVSRRGRVTRGPVRSFRVLPAPGSGARVSVAIGACASGFGAIFDQLAARRPDAFVWQGDLNYPDTIGPLAQTVPAYAGIWRDFLANPRMAELFEHSLFAAQRDDHDYGVQDANSTNLVPWGLTPWEALMEQRRYYRFAAGLAEFWVLDERRFKSDPKLPDTPAKTLLGEAQRSWLMRTLAASRAPFKVVCSPCTLAPLPANGRDGSWATGFTAERDLLLGHVKSHVSGQTLFVTGDTHWTMVYDRDGLFEARPCPLGIPTPNDITLTEPNAADDARKTAGVAYADDRQSHFALIEVDGTGLNLTLVREDGAEPYKRAFKAKGRSEERP